MRFLDGPGNVTDGGGYNNGGLHTGGDKFALDFVKIVCVK